MWAQRPWNQCLNRRNKVRTYKKEWGMGVPGLSSYIRKDESNFREIKLRDTLIIFDGLNILNQIYMGSSIFTQYNGEYLEYDIAIERFLNNLQKCNLEPIFVYDGIHEVDILIKM